ncbi:Uncharacterized protein M6B38_239540 [Iris pallida]|uniref:Uncharacterized protein n=1 Tax=Iris pallida TaxID=29817 RepID=A0AAX6DKV1_IRIPA|nr:Uncharacterized protein M6B38_239540 [Iris pallida]
MSSSSKQYSPMPKNKKSTNPNEIMEEEESPSASQEHHQQQQQQFPLASPRRKPPMKAKKKPIPKKKLAIINGRLSFLSKNLRPVPSLPSPKALADLVLPHEPLFRSLGLWDFARLDPSSLLRRDLLAELLARFDPADRCSYVRGARVNVTRADLARALSLPVRKEKPEPSAAPAPLDDAAQGALLGFISDAMVFLEDAAEVPGEVVQAQRMVREGRAGWVDWAGLVWAMVEKEMAEAPRTGICYYAAHLQCLIRFQKPKLFEEEEEKEEEVEVDEEMEEDPPAVAEECNPEAPGGPGLSMGIGADTMEDMDGVTIGGLSKGEENVEVDMEDGFHNELASKFPPLERLSSMDLMQAIGNHNNLSFNLEQSNGDFLGMGHDIHKSMELDPGPGSSLLFANDHKRRIDEIGNGENGNIHGFHQSNQQPKKFQSDMPWEQTQSVLAFGGCIGDIHNLMGNARMVLVEKEKAFMNSQLHVQYLNRMLQQKEEIIQSLERNMLQERQKRHIDACRLEHELSTLSNVLFNYKKAMKDTRNAFAKYKTKFPPEVEPVLKNGVVGTGGVVPGTEGLGKTCSTEEEEMHKVAVEMINDFQENWMCKFAAYHTQVTKTGERLVELHGEVKLLKGKPVEAKDD